LNDVPCDSVGDRTIVELLDGWVAESAVHTALVVESLDGAIDTLSYQDLAERSRHVATGLMRLGASRGDRVLVQLPNCADIVVTWFALMRLGAIFVPSNTMNTAREVAHIVKVSGAKLAICEPAGIEIVQAADARFDSDSVVVRGDATRYPTSFESLLAEPLDHNAGWPAMSSDDVIELVFTSGTTSAPKAAMITHANGRFSGLQKAASMELRAEDRLLSALPFFHVNAQSAFLAALTVGAPFVLLEGYSARRFFDQLERHRATVTSFVSTQVRTLLRQADHVSHRSHAVRRAWFALDLSESERDEFRRRFGIVLYNGYGLTEAFTSVSQSPLHGDARWPAVGLPLLGREIRVVGQDGRSAARDEPGEIIIRGNPGRTVMKGYWNDRLATDAALRDGWLHTGDSGRIDERGYLHFVGRKADLIKRAGENVAAAEVESVIINHPTVAEVAVIGVPDPIRDEAVKAFVVLRQGVTVDFAELEAWAGRRLASFKVPTEWALVTTLPRTPLGKIQKAALRDLDARTPV
jgi:crotonobetaine/carnitine-CoA ligase